MEARIKDTMQHMSKADVDLLMLEYYNITEYAGLSTMLVGEMVRVAIKSSIQELDLIQARDCIDLLKGTINEASTVVEGVKEKLLTTTATDCRGLTLLEALDQEVTELRGRYAKLKPSLN